ncbi:polyprenyl synthetase family protein [Actinospica sp.]|jgi:geranylgeranyl diphosphate synthase type I|uniref:polyprenyl synthetase family protein n=1 Tax=Actinospica sp. TaxID=1872142 RepID=UPI002C22E05B|nr:polyprenyl synthetase family protein [Actinospica sp.]HWG26140.1 polyprenyl synthetase family protein [Actinospica sp.]
MRREPAESVTLKPRVDAALREFVENEVAEFELIDPRLAPVGARLREAVSGGKRIRAAFCYWGWRACGQADTDAVVRAAASMELVHAAAITHDDLIDDSALRRGVPSAHVALLDALPGLPDRAWAARSLAMLAGDLLMSWAGQLFATCGLPAAFLARARPLWSVLARELIAGECLEILHTGATDSPQDSLRIIRYKTAKYTVEHPLQIGGRLGGASAALLAAFTAYGVPLGEAFQLRDDLLAVYGDPAQTGKSNLDDLAGARPTALVALATRDSTPDDREELHSLLGRADLAAPDLERVRKILERSGARERVEQMIAQRTRAAHAALTRVPLLDAVAATALHELADTVTERRA